MIVAVLLSSSPIQAQEDWRTQFASVLELRDSILKLVPYHDSVYHLTIQKVTLDVDYKYMRFLVDMDKGQNLEVADWYLDYLVRHSCWDFVPLGEKGFEIRMVVQTPKYERKASGGGSYTFSSDDIPLKFDSRYVFSDTLIRISRVITEEKLVKGLAEHYGEAGIREALA